MKRFPGYAFGAAALALLSACAPTVVQRSVAEPPPITLPRSALHEVPSADGRRYQVWVDLPESYFTSDQPLPALFVADPDWAFSTVRGIRELVGRDGRNIEDFILVGLGRDPALDGSEARARDYTPTDPRARAAYDPTDYDYPAYGQSAAYADYLATRVLPFVTSRYRVDPRRTTYLGHSYGGLFGATLLLTRPGLFENYILGSPSLWFDRHVIFRLEAARASQPGAVRGRLFMLTGSEEAILPENMETKKHDLVADMQRFHAVLASRGHPELAIESQVADGEDHLTVFPDVVTRGLLHLLPGPDAEPRDGS